MGYRDPQKALRALYKIANTQGGYFTAKQANTAGYERRHVDYHVKAGNFERIINGLFRIPTIPVGEHDDLIRISLWSRGRDDAPQGVFSHITALTLYDLSEIIPHRIHLTVPPSFRKDPPKECVLHRDRLASSEIRDRGEFRVTTPLRTIIDLAKSSNASREQLQKATDEALDRGLIRQSQLKNEIDKNSELSWLLSKQKIHLNR